MNILVKKVGKVPFEEYFPTVEDFVLYIDKHPHFINTKSLIDKIKNVYQNMKLSKTDQKLSKLEWRVIEEFCFINKSAFKLDFWIERGNSLLDFNKWLCKRRNVEPVKSMEAGTVNKFKYGKYKFIFSGEPVCNLCNSKLIFDILVDTYIIKGCKNENCATNSNKNVYGIRQLAFLPKHVFIGKNKRRDINSRVMFEYWLLKGCSYSESLYKVKEIKKELKKEKLNSIDYYAIRLGVSKKEAIGIAREKQYTLTEDYWKSKGFEAVDAKLKISNMQKSNSNKLSQKRKNNPYAYSSILPNQIGYWKKKGFTSEESKKKITNRQSTFTLEKCIKKYGEKEGINIFTKRQYKWQRSLIANGNLKNGHSTISQELFNLLLKYYEKNAEYVFFATKNEEYKIEKEGGGIWMYDFADTKRKKIIEYHGDMYHGNPMKYKESDNPHPFRKTITAKEMWEKDEKKQLSAKNKGFEVLVIWDTEYRWGNKQNVIKKCLKFLDINV